MGTLNTRTVNYPIERFSLGERDKAVAEGISRGFRCVSKFEKANKNVVKYCAKMEKKLEEEK